MKRFSFCLIFALSVLGSAAQSVYPGQHRGKLAIDTSVDTEAESFDLCDVRLLPGRVRDNLERDSAWMVSIPVGRMLHSFRNNAGVFAGLEGGYESVVKPGGWESLDCDLRGHTTGHLLSAYGLMYAATGAEVFRLKGDSLTAGLAEVQEALGADGYLSAFPQELINRNMRGQSVWAPWYTLHKLMSGLIDQYLYAGNTEALRIATRMGEWAYGKLAGQDEATRRLMLRNEFGGMNEAFYNLYAVTADSRFRSMAEYFYHNAVIDPLKDGDTDFGTKHTNTFIPKVIGEVRNYELTGNTESRAVAELFWAEMTHRHTFATGSCSQKEHYFEPERMSHYLNGYTGETCCTYNMLKLSRHIFCLRASAETADYYERALFNHILAQQDPESGMV
ncbi:MAG: glycoside hydrolase family 127 protein, partial [Muribaculaceae bacterium]|nr:glycoside hydrolase family 127 protein [Muribaculaceae bacterium]